MSYRDKGPKNICSALCLSEKAKLSEDRSKVGKMQDFELYEQVMTEKVGGSMPRRSISSANEVEVKKCVLSSRVTFQEILLIRICIVNVQDKWELGNI